MIPTTRRAAAGLLVLALLAGCGRGTGQAPEQAQDVTTGAVSGEITVWAIGEEGKALDAFAAGFESANPGIKVNVTPISWEPAHDKIDVSLADWNNDRRPDLVILQKSGTASGKTELRVLDAASQLRHL